jgi:cold-inducible RNA-binding protein
LRSGLARGGASPAWYHLRMTSKLFVGGLPFHYSNTELKALFAPIGTVISAEMVFDSDRARTRGFGFVEMGSPDQAQEAIASLNGQKVGEKQIYVTVAREKSARPSLGNPRFPKIPNRKVGRDEKSRPARSQRPAWPPAGPQFPDSRRSLGARPSWPPPRGERPFDKPPRRYKGNKPFDRSAPGFPPRPKRPTDKPAKKAFWHKFDKRRPPKPND